jgi:type III secretory pathway component EscU
MTDTLITSVVTVIMAIIGVAILAVLVSRQSQTGQVIGAAANAFAQDLGVAISPISGGSRSSFLPGGVNFNIPTVSFG